MQGPFGESEREKNTEGVSVLLMRETKSGEEVGATGSTTSDTSPTWNVDK